MYVCSYVGWCGLFVVMICNCFDGACAFAFVAILDFFCRCFTMATGNVKIATFNYRVGIPYRTMVGIRNS